ncbi:hypothetical protein CHLRE_03g193700v5 [Chlamydomonas reinhardtii]|uniref:AB hydrolase-1 domain-containing protein n=1 Tax=Chlamydomonas reinhardtii TaxID=3055 RepID=A0A2K3DYK2_CHLRE|nr:uncharacterized protein CHLRE_03g193700v5 [Chlamydomonas reinhardtii]PNW85587.1 hypothetical protein CHLRE_03g193700v5 [Chlamydomonas reinhardtii]
MDGAPGSKRQRTDGTLARASAREVPGTLPGTVAVEVAGVLPRHEVGQTFLVPGLVIREHFFTVPLDYNGSEATAGKTITIFAREVMAPARNESLPWLVYLQGGPGFEAPRMSEVSIWVRPAISSHRLLLLDQRGTGRSTPITTTNLPLRGGPEEQAEYLSYFRADSIIKDCEVVRRLLVPPTSFGGRWSVLGQSFGGFCATTYLSQAPAGLMEVLITGGLPPGISLPCSAETVYTALHKRVIAANHKYYDRFPNDVEQMQRIVKYLAEQPGGGATLPDGTLLTPRLLQTLGLSGLGSGGGFERLHYLLDGFFDAEGHMTPAFAKAFDAWHSWDSNPLYALVHEAIYCQGGEASNWAADRVRAQEPFASQFDAVAAAEEGRRVLFTGECVYRFMFEDLAPLRPLLPTADVLAARTEWGPLYDAKTLASNKVPTAALAYVEDLYVDFGLSQETASSIRGIKLWTTNEYRHSGIRDDGSRIFERLLGMARNVIFD